MRWIGQHIWDFISRFRSDVYLEDIADGAVVDNKFLGLDSNNKIVKEAASTTVTDLHTAGVDGADNQLLTDKGDGTITSEANATYNGADLTLTSGTTAKPRITIENSNTDASSPHFIFQKTAAGADNDDLGTILFKGDNDNNEVTPFATILAEIASASDSDEAGKLSMIVMASDGSFNHSLPAHQGRNAFTATGHGTHDYVSTTIGYGTPSVATIAGNLALSGDTITSAADLNIVATGNDINVDTDSFTIESANNHFPSFNLKNTIPDSLDGAYFYFMKDRGSAALNGDVIGTMVWRGENDAEQIIDYGKINVSALEVDDTDEAGKMSFFVAESNGTSSDLTAGLVIEGSDNATDGEVHVTIAAGAASNTTIAGDLHVIGDSFGVNGANVATVSGLGAITIGQANRPLALSATSIDMSAGPGCTVDIDRRKFSVTSGTDGNHAGDVVYFGNTTSMTVGNIYHYNSGGGWEQADADDITKCDGLLAVALGANSNTNGMLLRGMVTLDHDPGAVGDVLFLSTTAGDATATAPSGNNDIVRIIGYCLHASAGNIWFNPDNTFVKVTA